MSVATIVKRVVTLALIFVTSVSVVVSGMVVLAAVSPTPAVAGSPSHPGALDDSFVRSTITGFDSENIKVIEVQPDGKILVGGGFQSYYGQAAAGLIRLNADGTVDTSFSFAAGRYGAVVDTVSVLASGKILVGGSFPGGLVRLNADGSVDPSFALEGRGLSGTPRSLAVDSQGRIIVGGTFLSYDDAPVSFLVRLKPNGARDRSFSVPGSGANNVVNTVVVLPGDQILAGGEFTAVSGTEVNRLARFTSTGDLDPSFNQGGSGFNRAVEVLLRQPDGQLLVGGKFDAFNGEQSDTLVRLTGSGQRDATFSVRGIGRMLPLDWVTGLRLQPDGKIIVTSSLGPGLVNLPRNTFPILARLNPDGSLDVQWPLTTLDVAVETPAGVDACALTSDGSVIAAGSMSTSSAERWSLQKFDSSGKRDSDFSPPGSGFNSVPSEMIPLPDGRFFALYWGALNGTPVNGPVLLKADGTRDPSFATPSDLHGSFYSDVEVQPDGKVLASGWIRNADGAQRAVVRYNPDGSEDPTFQVTDSGASVMGLQQDGRILLSDHTEERVWRINSNGSRDSGFVLDPSVTGQVSLIRPLPDGKALLAGSMNVAGLGARRLVRVRADGSLDPGFALTKTGAGGQVRDVEVQSDGRILVGGDFTRYDDATHRFVVRLKPDGTIDPTFSTTTSASNYLDGFHVASIAVQPDGRIIIGGGFDRYGSTPLANVARLNADGSLDTAYFLDGTGFSGSVEQVVLQPDGRVLVGGWFTRYNNTAIAHVARLLGDGPQAGLSATPSLPFYSQLVGSSSQASLTVTSTGQVDLNVTSVALAGADRSEFAIAAQTCTSAPLAPSRTCRVDVRFQPTSLGSKDAFLQLVSNSASSPDSVSLAAVAAAPRKELSVMPPSITFPITERTMSSPAVRVFITNSGTLPVTFPASAFRFDGANPADFRVTSDRCSSTVLNPRAVCDVSVAFQPDRVGTRVSRLVIGTDAPERVVDLAGTGAGTNPPQTPVISVDPTSLDFGNVEMKTSSPAQTITIRNVGPAAFIMQGRVIEDPAFIATDDTCSNVWVPVGGSCTVQVRFSPQTLGGRTVDLALLPFGPDWELGAVTRLILKGVGIRHLGSVVALSPGALKFGHLKVGESSEPERVEISSGNGLPVAMRQNAVELGGADTGQFEMTRETCSGRVLLDDVCFVEIIYRPTQAGDAAAVVTVSSDADSSPDTFKVTGSASTTTSSPPSPPSWTKVTVKRRAVRATWEAVPTATGYRVKVKARSLRGKRILKTRTTPATSARVKLRTKRGRVVKACVVAVNDYGSSKPRCGKVRVRKRR